jgi:predicted dehydrogenase
MSRSAHRAAVIGTGFMGRLHVESLRRAGVHVVGLLGSTPVKTQAFCDAWQIPRAYRTLEELLDDPQVEVVHIGTPNHLHFEQTKACILAGKHVLCEKPLAMTSAESQTLVDLAARHPHLVCGVNYNVRFYPHCLEMRARIARGELGRVFHVAGCYVQDWLLRETDYNWRVLAEQGGSLRAVADIGTHWLDLVSFITGQRVVAVCADLYTAHPQRWRPEGEIETFAGKSAPPATRHAVPIATDDYAALLLKFADGARGNVWVSQVTAGRKNHLQLEIAGSERAICWSSDAPEDLWIGQRDQPNGLLARDPSLLDAVAAEHCSYPGGHVEGYGDSFKQCFRAFYRSLEDRDRGADRLFATFADGHRELAICDAVLESAARGAWVEVGP